MMIASASILSSSGAERMLNLRVLGRSELESGAMALIGFEVSWVIALRGNVPESHSASPQPVGRRRRAGSRRRSIPARGRGGYGHRPAGFEGRLSGKKRNPSG